MTKASVLGCEPVQKRVMEGDTTDGDGGPTGGREERELILPVLAQHASIFYSENEYMCYWFKFLNLERIPSPGEEVGSLSSQVVLPRWLQSGHFVLELALKLPDPPCMLPQPRDRPTSPLPW